eukprot:SAG31_NODE_46773_length_253_cov_0.662338_1_plen_36_part_01
MRLRRRAFRRAQSLLKCTKLELKLAHVQRRRQATKV